MELLFLFIHILGRYAVITASVHFISIIIARSVLDTAPDLRISIAIGLSLGWSYGQWIIPWRSPWKHLPSVKVEDIRMVIPVTDVPRGEAALEWATQHQDTDILLLRVAGAAPVLFPISIAAIRDLLSTHQDDFIKPTGASAFLANLLGYGLILSEGKVHARQRKSLTSSFKVQNVRALHALMQAKTEILLANMAREDAKSNGRGIDITKWASKVTLDIIGIALMSKEFDSLNIQDQPVNDAFSRLTEATPEGTIMFILSLLLPQFIVRNLPTAMNRQFDRDVSTVRQSCEQSLSELKKRMKHQQPDNSDILASIVADPEASHKEVIDQMVTFLGAGHETTSTSIAWITHLLTLPENQRYQDLLREEIRASPGCTDSPTTLESLPWLNAICEETLRLFPPVTNTGRKAIRETTLAGIRLPPGSTVVLFPWAINRLPKYWGGEDAAKFIPERWLDQTNGAMRLNGNGGAASNFCNLTFLHGNRSCIGKGFAKAELRLVIARLYGGYTVSRLPGDDGKVVPSGALTVKPEGGLFVTLKEVR